MVTWLFSPWGIPASYREMHGSGVNTSKWVNAAGEAVLVKYHWDPKQGERNLTQAEAEAIQATNFNHATQDLYDAIERGDYPEWELQVQSCRSRSCPTTSTRSSTSTRSTIPSSGRPISSPCDRWARWS